MKRKVYLKGELGQLFGEEHQILAPHVSDILKCIEANQPSIRQYLSEAVENGVEYSLQVKDSFLDEKDLLTPLEEGDVTITPAVSGAKSGGAKVLTAAVIFAVLILAPASVIPGLQSGAGQSIFAASQAAGGLTATAGLAAMSIATNLALTGISQLLAPDPSVDKDQEDGAFFSGSLAKAIEGDPVPLLYGELLIPGQPISIALKSISASEAYTGRNLDEANFNEAGENSSEQRYI